MRRRADRWTPLRSTFLATLLLLTAFAALPASAQPSTPPPSPTGTQHNGPSAAMPNATTAPMASGVVIVKDTDSSHPSCTGFRSQTTPPASIRVLITRGTSSPKIVTVPFMQYVQGVLPAEWVPSWNSESLKAGAVAVKSYGWFWVNHYGGYLGTRSPSTCFDVTDTQAFQVYDPARVTQPTDDAVQQTWGVVARDATTHEVRQTFYICSLPYTSTTNCYKQGTAEKCGQAANGSQMSQWGSQACAVKGLDYRAILNTYYYQVQGKNPVPPLELATVTQGPVSVPPAAPVVLSAAGTLVAFRIAGGDLLSSSQSSPGSAFGAWAPVATGTQLTGQPAALLAYNKTIVVYARTTNGQVVGIGQSRPGGAFTGWKPIGGGGPGLASDPVPILAANGALVIYGTAFDGNVWGVGQTAAGVAFSPWQRLSNTGTFSSSKPAALLTAAGQLVVYARANGAIYGAGQSRAFGPFSAFAPIGQGQSGATGDPAVYQAGDGTLSIVAAGSGGLASGVWTTGQPAPGTAFGAWRQISDLTSYVSTPAAHAFRGGPVVVYAVTGGTVQGAQALTPASSFSRFGNMGSGTPQAAGNPYQLFAANGAMVLYVMGADGYLWGTGQSRPGSAFSPWLQIGS